MKLCIDCKHYTVHPQTPNRPDLGLCQLAPSPRDPVDGSYEYSVPFKFCRAVRNSPCGSSARMYEPKASAFPEMPAFPEVKHV